MHSRLEDHELDRISAKVVELFDVLILNELRDTKEQIMSALDDTNAKLAKLGTDVDALIALQQAADQTPGIEALGTSIDVIDAKVTAITAPPVVEPAPAEPVQ